MQPHIVRGVLYLGYETMKILKTTCAALAFVALPFTASALTVLPTADVTAPEDFSFSATVDASEDGVQFTFQILEDLIIPFFSLSSSAPSGGSTTTTYEISNPAVGPTPFGQLNLDTIGADVTAGTTYSAGDIFTITLLEGVDTPISYTVSFATQIAAVPVPAAGLLLLTALGGAAAMRRRKTSAAA